MFDGKNSRELFSLTNKGVYKFREEPYLLASGKESQHYYDCKYITMNPEYLQLLAFALRDELIPSLGLPLPDAIGGLTLGADPISFALSLAYWQEGKRVYPYVVRKKTKGHGTSEQVEYRFPQKPKAGLLVLVIEDTITTGSSSLQAVKSLRELGLEVKHCLAIVDRGEGGRENLSVEGVSLSSLYHASDFL